MHDMAARNAGVALRMPRSRIAQYECHRWQRLQVLLVDVLKLVDIAWIGAEPDTKRIQDGVAFRELLLDFRNFPVDQLVVVDRHALLPGGWREFSECQEMSEGQCERNRFRRARMEHPVRAISGCILARPFQLIGLLRTNHFKEIWNG